MPPYVNGYAQDCALLPKWEITKVQPDSTLVSFLESVRNDTTWQTLNTLNHQQFDFSSTLSYTTGTYALLERPEQIRHEIQGVQSCLKCTR